MKMKCAHCGGVISSKCNYCKLCGESTYKQRSKRCTICVSSVVGGIVAFLIACSVLHSNYLMPWQIPLYKDRKAIIQYVREKHPNSKIVEEHIKYRFEGSYFIITGASPDCYITFEEDGFQYRVFANDGKVYSDSYSQSKFSNDIETFINEKFLIPRGIENVDIHCTFSADELPFNWSEYNSKVSIYMEIVGHGDTPYEVGWLYDFYKFWCENQKFSSKWYINFRIGKQCAFYVGYDEKIDNAAQMYEKAFPKYD